MVAIALLKVNQHMYNPQVCTYLRHAGGVTCGGGGGAPDSGRQRGVCTHPGGLCRRHGGHGVHPAAAGGSTCWPQRAPSLLEMCNPPCSVPICIQTAGNACCGQSKPAAPKQVATAWKHTKAATSGFRCAASELPTVCRRPHCREPQTTCTPPMQQQQDAASLLHDTLNCDLDFAGGSNGIG